MIQTSLPKPAEIKAPKSAEVKVASEKAKSASLSKSEKAERNEFAKELKASMGQGSEEVSAEKPVEEKASAGKAPAEKSAVANARAEKSDKKQVPVDVTLTAEATSAFVNVPSSVLNPTAELKTVDPALTEAVEVIKRPGAPETPVKLTDAELLKLGKTEVPAEAKAELAPELKADPKIEISELLGRAPSKAPAKAAEATTPAAEKTVEANLVNLEDFVAQKSVKKAAAPVAAYGLAKAQQQKLALESGLKSTQVVKEASALESSAAPVSSQQFILNMMNEQKSSPQASEAQAAPKVFDLGQLKGSGAETIMNQISDYLVQAKASKEPTVSLRVSHQDLGLIDITVNKMATSGAPEALAISIGAHSVEGQTFFQQNSKDLLSHMSQAGISVSDLRLETPAQSGKSDFDFNQQNSKQSGSEKQYGSEQNQRKHESDRRQDLWKLLNKEAA